MALTSGRGPPVQSWTGGTALHNRPERGYPDGLRGDAIPPSARIMAVVDVFDSLTTTRPCRTAMPPVQAAQALEEETVRGAWHPDVVAILIGILRRHGTLPAIGDVGLSGVTAPTILPSNGPKSRERAHRGPSYLRVLS